MTSMCLTDEEEIQEISPIKVTWLHSGESDDSGVFKRKETGFGAHQTCDVLSTPQALWINRQNRLNVLDPGNSKFFGHVLSIEHRESAAAPALWAGPIKSNRRKQPGSHRGQLQKRTSGSSGAGGIRTLFRGQRKRPRQWHKGDFSCRVREREWYTLVLPGTR